MERLELYVYTTETDLEKGYIKVGHSIVGRHEERIKEQFGTSNSRPPIWKLIGELPEGQKQVLRELLEFKGVDKEFFITYITARLKTLEDFQSTFGHYILSNEEFDSLVEDLQNDKEPSEAILKARENFLNFDKN